VRADQQYRKEIDGLRALAVLAVVAFHAQIAPFSGGFVGVDIFFVISGYLITQVILKDADGSGFSLITFYERRIRRIMPALLAVMCVTLLAAWLLMLPEDLDSVSRSVFSMTLFSSNFYFWNLLQNYFAAQTETLPLLHTWSLAVEEQFYVFFPLFLMVARPLGKQMVNGLIAAIALGSFAVCVWLVAAGHSQTAFYIPVARAWELMLGALVAADFIPAIKSRSLGEAIAWSGLLLIIATLFLVNSQTPFPGWAALPPTLGTVMILRGAEVKDSSAARLLSIPPLRLVGCRLIPFISGTGLSSSSRSIGRSIPLRSPSRG
jgi:peptidoglycan/LPS O-acetylase OafA/YrhL